MKLPFGSFSKTDSSGYKVIKPLLRRESPRTVSLPVPLQLVWVGLGWLYGFILAFVAFCVTLELCFIIAFQQPLEESLDHASPLPTYIDDAYRAIWGHYGLTPIGEEAPTFKPTGSADH